MTEQRKGPVVLAAGGTGGHMFPALALAIELKRRGHVPIIFTDKRGVRYAEHIEGLGIVSIPAANPSGGVFRKMRAAIVIARGVLKARRLIKRVEPDAVLGFGGYPSLPTMLAATWRRLPTVLHEQNAVLGRANRFLIPRVSLLAASVEGVGGVPPSDAGKVVVTGNPVRPEIVAIGAERYHPFAADDPQDAIRVVIFGGSQGARVMDEVVPQAIRLLPPAVQRRVKVVQQCREDDIAAVESVYKEAGIEAELLHFITDMPSRLSTAHLVIARSGATTVSELIAAGRPAILIPYPHHADQQQLANARALAERGAAWVVEEKDLSVAELAKRLQRLLTHPDVLERASRAAQSLANPKAASALADLVERAAAERSGRRRRGRNNDRTVAGAAA